MLGDSCLGSLNKNGPRRLIYLNTWSSVGETVWEGLGGMVLLEGVCLEVGFEVKKKKTLNIPS